MNGSSGFSLVNRGSPMYSLLEENAELYGKMNILADDRYLKMLIKVVEEGCDVFEIDRSEYSNTTTLAQH